MGAKSVIITRDSPGKARQQKKTRDYRKLSPDNKKLSPDNKKISPDNTRKLSRKFACIVGRYFCFSKEPKLNGGCQLPRNSEIFQENGD